MIDFRNDNKWTVYVHVNKLNQKMYFGITSTSTWKRWGTNGIHYKPYDGTRCRFWNAIAKYGFNNFDHIIIAEHLTKEEACKMEISLIDKFKTTDDNYGYNILFGGDGVEGHYVPKGENHYLSIQIYQYDKDFNLIKKWGCLSDVIKEVELSTDYLIKKSCDKKCLYLNSFWSYNEIIDDRFSYTYESINNPSKTKKYKPCGDSVFQYDTCGVLVNVYNNINEVMKINQHFSKKNLLHAYNHETTSYENYIWSETTDVDFVKYLILCNISCHKMDFIPIVQTSKDGSFINKYNSAREAELKTGFASNKIFDNCTNRIKSSQGYVWKFNNEYFDKLGLDSSFLMSKKGGVIAC